MSKRDDGEAIIESEVVAISNAFENAANGCRSGSVMAALVMALGSHANSMGLCTHQAGALFAHIGNHANKYRQQLSDASQQLGRPN